MPETVFTPVQSLMGGAMIGLAAVMLMGLNGRIAGISGIASRLFTKRINAIYLGRLAFVIGLMAAPLVALAVTGHWPTLTIATPTLILLPAGVLVGIGTVYGNGCTSGHGVCGLSLLSRRSMLATSLFMVAAALTVFVVRHLL